MKQEENAIPAYRASLASSQRVFFFYKSENAKEILFKVELQSMKSKLVAVWTGHLCRSSDLMSDIRRSQHT